MTNRRAFLLGIGAALAAPAVIRTAGLLMPIQPVLDIWMVNWGPTIELYGNSPMVLSKALEGLVFWLADDGFYTIDGHGEARPLPPEPIDVWNRENA